jgi:hypothetical protein
MRSRLLRWLLPVPLALACCLSPAHAQAPSNPADAKESDKSPPALQYALAGLFTILVLLLICVPSRKGTTN